RSSRSAAQGPCPPWQHTRRTRPRGLFGSAPERSADRLVGSAPLPGYPAHMSMLTPPGMGGKYRITGNRYPRMRPPRRRRRVVLTALATATTLGVAGWGAWELVGVFTGGGETSRAQEADPACSPQVEAADAKPVRLPEPKDITVN